MSSLQRLIIKFSQSSANLIAQLRELDQVRDQLRKAQASARHGRNIVISAVSPDWPTVIPSEAAECLN
jgi:hypothetical protein